MTHKQELDKLVQEIVDAEHLLDDNGHLPSQYCPYWIISRTQRIDEIARYKCLKGTYGYEERGCYACNVLDPHCDIRLRCEIDKSYHNEQFLHDECGEEE